MNIEKADEGFEVYLDTERGEGLVYIEKVLFDKFLEGRHKLEYTFDRSENGEHVQTSGFISLERYYKEGIRYQDVIEYIILNKLL